MNSITQEAMVRLLLALCTGAAGERDCILMIAERDPYSASEVAAGYRDFEACEGKAPGAQRTKCLEKQREKRALESERARVRVWCEQAAASAGLPWSETMKKCHPDAKVIK